jgi:hypothetical protein
MHGENNLAIVSSPVFPINETKPRTYATKLERRNEIRSTDMMRPEERKMDEPSEIINQRNSAANPAWTMQPVTRDVDSTHDLFLYANIDNSLRIDLQTYGFNPGANILWEGVNASSLLPNMATATRATSPPPPS